MEQFKTDIRFPRGENPDQVLVTGTQENCEACIEHLLTLEEEYVSNLFIKFGLPKKVGLGAITKA